MTSLECFFIDFQVRFQNEQQPEHRSSTPPSRTLRPIWPASARSAGHAEATPDQDGFQDYGVQAAGFSQTSGISAAASQRAGERVFESVAVK